MNGWDSFTQGLYGLLHEQGRLQKIINYRAAIGKDKADRKNLMIRSIGLAAWEDLLIYYGGFSDQQLQNALHFIQQDIELRLSRHYISR